jgi:predicted Zn-ribbon and HTH transcriptional regulator
MQQCPKCKSDAVHRSHTKNFLESWKKMLTTKRPHRCQKCGWRGWGEETAPKFDADQARKAERSVVPERHDIDLSTF